MRLPFSRKEEKMELGQKIKKIRMFRGMTQKELGIRLGYDGKSADVRIAQYESGARVPKRETLSLMADILQVNVLNFIKPYPGSAADFMQLLFWLDEENRNTVHLFSMETGRANLDGSNHSDIAFCLKAAEEKPVTGIRLEYGGIDECLQNWMEKKRQLKNKEISEKDYLEWKWNWPYKGGILFGEKI